MTVRVKVWFPSGGDIGHAAMEVDGGSPPGLLYFSRWPGSLAAVFFIGAGEIHTFETDVSDEHRRQPSVVTLTKLNETNIKIAMKLADKVSVYGFATANCAQQVGWCLRQGLGVAGGVVDMTFARIAPQLRDAAILTPWNLYAYAQSLRPVYG
jgi:hypothetical protein